MENKLQVFSKKFNQAVSVEMGDNGLQIAFADTDAWADWSNGPWHNFLGWSNGWNDTWSNGCYITTACVEHKGLGDDCDELTTMRRFRDHAIEDDPKFREKVIEYYEYAPKIVESIQKSDNTNQVLDELYSKMISPCVEMYKKGQLEEVKALYLSYYENLKAKYIDIEER